MSLKGKKIVVGLTGGIACYKIPYLVRLLVKAEAEVQVVMTNNATKFITPLTLETVSKKPVAVKTFPTEYVGVHHIDLAQWPDLLVIAPATANFLGKIASGISDDLLTTVICATPHPLMIAPAMNPHMWQNKATEKNCTLLREWDYLFIGPDEGETACDQSGLGRMVEPSDIFSAIEKYFLRSSKKKA